jgi:Peptidase family C25
LDFEVQQDINATYLQPVPPQQATKMYFRLSPWNCSTKDGNANSISDVVEELNAGKAVSSWIGHGSFQQWGFNSFVDVSDMPDLSNATKPTVMLNANCFTGAFFHAFVQSLMEAFLLRPEGMVSGFAPGTYMYSFQSGFVTEPFYVDAFGLPKERNLGLLFQ